MSGLIKSAVAVKSWVRKRRVDKKDLFLFCALKLSKSRAKLMWGLPCRGGHTLEFILAAGAGFLGKQGHTRDVLVFIKATAGFRYP